MTDGTSGSEADTDAEVEILETAAKRVHSGKARATEQDSDDDEEGNEPVCRAHAADGLGRGEPVLAELDPKGPAQAAGLKTGDRLLALAG